MIGCYSQVKTTYCVYRYILHVNILIRKHWNRPRGHTHRGHDTSLHRPMLKGKEPVLSIKITHWSVTRTKSPFQIRASANAIIMSSQFALNKTRCIPN